MVLGTKEADSFVLNIGKNKIKNSTEVTLLGVKIDKQLKFKSHIEELCRKAAYKLHAWLRIRRYLTVEIAKLLANAFINSQFTYALLIWMFAGKSSIVKICNIHFRTLQIVYNNYDKSYHDLLNFSNDVYIYQKHLRFLAIEAYKSLMIINPELMWEFFNKNPLQYNLRKRDIVYLPPARSSSYGINSLAFRGILLCNSLPSNVKQSHNLKKFKLKLRNLGNIHCTCVVCR